MILIWFPTAINISVVVVVVKCRVVSRDQVDGWMDEEVEVVVVIRWFNLWHYNQIGGVCLLTTLNYARQKVWV